MRQAETIQAAYDLLNVPSVTGLLSTAYKVPAIFQEGMVPRTQSGDPLSFPYITINVPSDVDFSDKLNLGGNAIVQVDVWDRSGSKLILGGMMLAAINATVRKTWLGLPGFITCERESSDMIADPDGLTMHGLIRLRVLYLDATIPPDPLGPWSSEFSAEFG
jgi:hypothetical protein